MPQFNSYDNATSVSASHQYVLFDATKKATRDITADKLRRDVRNQERWLAIDPSKFTSTPNSGTTNRIDFSDTTGIEERMPARWTIGGRRVHGLVKNVSANSSVDVYGPTLTLTQDVTEFAIGRPDSAVLFSFRAIAAVGGVTVADYMATTYNNYHVWRGPPAYLSFYAANVRQATAPTFKINPTIRGERVGTEDSNLGITMANGDTSRALATEGAIDIDNYRIAHGDAFDFDVTATGTTAPLLNVYLYFVYE